ncbi:MAG: ArsR family transcriptional regulator [Phycisphaerae bacterium]
MAIVLTNLLGATRGQIIADLRSGPRTVKDLAAVVHLTQNAVRTHLAALESDGLVVACGTRPGSRKPHTLYELTADAQQMLSRLYIPVLSTLLVLLLERHPPEHVVKLVCDVGHRLAETHLGTLHRKSLKARIDYVVKLLSDMGGVVEVHQDKGKWVICVKGCLLAEAVTRHPHVCHLKETLLSDLLGKKVQEQCKKGNKPECCFVVGK